LKPLGTAMPWRFNSSQGGRRRYVENRMFVVAGPWQEADLSRSIRPAHARPCRRRAGVFEHPHFGRWALHAGGTRSDGLSRPSEALFAKMERELSSGVIGFRPSGDIADQEVQAKHFSADVDDAGFIGSQRFFRNVRCSRVISSGSELGIAGHHLESSMWIE